MAISLSLNANVPIIELRRIPVFKKISVMVACVLAVCMAGPLIAAEKTLNLCDYINHRWTNELVTYPLDFKPGTCRESSISLIGPDGPILFQLSDVKYYAGDFIQSARISFLTDLPALGKKTFTIEYGVNPGSGKMPGTDLVVSKGDGYVELATNQVGVCVLSGEKKYQVPMTASDVPGPLLGIKGPKGEWVGGSRLYGNRKVLGYTTSLRKGPVISEAEVQYAYDDGSKYSVTVRLVASQEVAFIESKSDVHAPSDGFSFNITHGLPNPVLTVRGKELNVNNLWGLKNNEFGSRRLSDVSSGEIFSLVPCENWWLGNTRSSFDVFSNENKTAVGVGSYDPGAWIEPKWGKEYNLDPWHLREFKDMPLVKDSSGEVSLQCSSAIGVRKWFVTCLPWNDDPVSLYSEINHLHSSKYGCQTLDMVKDYALDLPSDPKVVYPRLYVAPKDVEAVRHKLGSAQDISRMVHAKYLDMQGKPHVIGGTDLLQYAVDTAYGDAVDPTSDAGAFDYMRTTWKLMSLCDALLGCDQVSDSEKRLIRSQLAFIGYTMSSPYVWDRDRGFIADPNNMHISYMCGRGLIACLSPDNPMSKSWAESADGWVNKYGNPGR